MLKRVIAAALLVCLLLYGAVNYRLIIDALNGAESFEGFAEALTGSYPSKMIGKEDLIDIAGLAHRITLRSYCNGTIKLSNGYLAGDSVDEDPAVLAESIAVIAETLRENGIGFVYVQIPQKMDADGELVPLDLNEIDSRENIDALVASLTDRGVDVIDLRETLAADAEAVERSFYKTDHHWRTDAAFTAFAEIMAYLDANGYDVRAETADRELWDKHTLENIFLGSRGKRTGTLYAGIDDLDWYTPAFQTDIRYIDNHKDDYRRGSFEETVLRSEYLTGDINYYNLNHYCVFFGGDYPLTTTQNAAAGDTRVMVIEDSYALPVKAFMAAGVGKVDGFDPRHNDLCTAPEYALITKPDVVVMLHSPKNADAGYYDTAVSFTGEITLTAMAPDDFGCVYTGLAEGDLYCLTLAGSEGAAEEIRVGVCDEETGTIVDWGMIDAALGGDYVFRGIEGGSVVILAGEAVGSVTLRQYPSVSE